MPINSYNLVGHLPKAGFRWPASAILNDRAGQRLRRDQRIVEVLRKHGDCPRLAPGAKGSARAEVSRALGQMFKEAERLERAGASTSKDTFDFLEEDVRPRVAWGLALRPDTFTELFYELYLARGRWYEDPQDPYDTKEHGELAHKIDAYHSAAESGSWRLPDIELLELAGGFLDREDEDEDEDEKEKEKGEGEGAAEDKEVREVRERLAKARLEEGEEMEVDDEEGGERMDVDEE